MLYIINNDINFIKEGFNIMKQKLEKIKNLPIACPSCREQLHVKRLICTKCQTVVEGLFPLPVLVSLAVTDQEFILQFIKSSGSLKEMSKIRGISYPTIRNKLDSIIEKIKQNENEEV